MSTPGSVVDDAQAPDIQINAGTAPDVSGPAATPTEPTVANQVIQQQAQNPLAGVSPTQPTSRLTSVLGGVASVLSTGLSGIPSQGRPSFVTGLGQGARAEQQAQATQQAIRFKSFEDSVRSAQLTNEETRMQWASEDQQNAVQANADAQAKRMTDTTGMTYTFVPNDDGGKAALDHMGVQMAQNGSVSVPAGTISGPKGWYIPNQGSAEQAQALTQDFNAAPRSMTSIPLQKVAWLTVSPTINCDRPAMGLITRGIPCPQPT